MVEVHQELARIRRSSAHLVVGQVLARLVSFFFVMYVARKIGVDDFGRLSLVISFLLFAEMGTEFGLGRIVVRDLARDADRVSSYLSVLLPAKGVLALGCYLALLGLLQVARYPPEIVGLAAIGGVALVISGATALLDNVLHARQHMALSAAGQLVFSLAQAGLGVAVLHAGGGLRALLWSYAAAYATYLLFLLGAARVHGFDCRPSPNLARAFALLRSSAPYAAVAVLTIFAQRAEVVVLGRMNEMASLGLFSAAGKFFDAALVLPIMVGAACTPVMARLHAEGPAKITVVFRRSQRLLLLAVVPASLGAVLLAGLIIGTLFPPEYSGAVTVLRVMFLAFPFTAAHVLNTSLLFSHDVAGRPLALAVAGTTLQYGLNFALTPRFGLQGALAAFACAQVALAVLSTACVGRWHLARGGTLRNFLQPLLGGIAMSATGWALTPLMGAWAIVPAFAAYALAVAAAAPWFPLGELLLGTRPGGASPELALSEIAEISERLPRP